MEPPSSSAPSPSGRTELNSRIETRMWRLVRGSDRAEGRKGVKFGHREFRVYVNGALLWSQNYGVDEMARLDEDAAMKYEEFITGGWTPETPDAGR